MAAVIVKEYNKIPVAEDVAAFFKRLTATDWNDESRSAHIRATLWWMTSGGMDDRYSRTAMELMSGLDLE